MSFLGRFRAFLDGSDRPTRSGDLAPLLHGQPSRALYSARVEDRRLTEMLGLCKGILLDHFANDGELQGLYEWCVAHPDAAFSFPCEPLARRLIAAFADGTIDEQERRELEHLIREVTGTPDLRPVRDISTSSFAATPALAVDFTTRVAFDDPAPELQFAGWEYVVTGTFAFGIRDRVHETLIRQGAMVGKSCTKRTRVLLVGMLGSDAWIQSTHGRKMERAVELRAQGQSLHIVPEEHWYPTIGS